ncbi:hypothetical protein LC612_32335 [Nostoc sp. CHAB 5834]|nr:hypothetical protein [Nostoc sp. CHAB 5834]
MANEQWLESLDLGMIESVERAEAGFYFEEGGCWAMAQALYMEMKAQGLEPRIHVRKEGVPLPITRPQNKA